MEEEKQHIPPFDGKPLFDTPDGYFENLPLRISERLPAREKSVDNRISLLKYGSLSVAAAASLVWAVIWLFSPGQNQEALLTADHIAEEIALENHLRLTEETLIAEISRAERKQAEDIILNELAQMPEDELIEQLALAEKEQKNHVQSQGENDPEDFMMYDLDDFEMFEEY